VGKGGKPCRPWGSLLMLAVTFYIVQLAADYFQAPAFILKITGAILFLVFLAALLHAFGLGPGLLRAP
jgi:hypothetical protein